MRARIGMLVLLAACGHNFNDGQVTVYLGTAEGGIEPGIEVPSIVGRASCARDFDGDGLADLAIAGVERVQLLLSQSGMLVAQSPVDIPHDKTDYVAISITCADLDEDGMVDVAVAGSEPEATRITIFSGDGRGGLQQGAEVLYLGMFDIGAKDVNSDGHRDLFAILDGASTALGNGDGTFQEPIYSSVDILALAGDIGDLDVDGVLDLVVTSTMPDGLFGEVGKSISILQGHGDGTFGEERSYEVGEEPNQVLVAQADADSFPDILVSTSDGIQVLRGDGRGTFAPATEIVPPPGLAGADWFVPHGVDGDGKLSIAAASGAKLTIFHAEGDGTFSAVGSQPRESHGRKLEGPELLSSLDINGDGLMDIVAGGRAGDEEVK